MADAAAAAPPDRRAGARDAGRIWPLEAIRCEVAPGRPGFSVELVPSIDSTNSELMRRAAAGLHAPVLLVAEQQTAGRGRLGRRWLSDGAAALTFSLGLALAPRDWSGLSLAVGVSVAGSLHPELLIKWPNDIWLHERKLAGILIETAGAPDHRYAVIGVGINIGPRAGAGLATPAAWLRELLPQADAPAVLQLLVPALVQAVTLFEAQGFGPFRAAFAARDLLHGRPVLLSDGVAGTAAGVDAVGALRVSTPTGVKVVTSAEVSVRTTGQVAPSADPTHRR